MLIALLMIWVYPQYHDRWHFFHRPQHVQSGGAVECRGYNGNRHGSGDCQPSHRFIRRIAARVHGYGHRLPASPRVHPRCRLELAPNHPLRSGPGRTGRVVAGLVDFIPWISLRYHLGRGRSMFSRCRLFGGPTAAGTRPWTRPIKSWEVASMTLIGATWSWIFAGVAIAWMLTNTLIARRRRPQIRVQSQTALGPTICWPSALPWYAGLLEMNAYYKPRTQMLSGIPVPVLIMICVAVGMSLLAKTTRFFGRYVFAIGATPKRPNYRGSPLKSSPPSCLWSWASSLLSLCKLPPRG